MSALLPTEIRPGLVCHFDGDELAAHEAVTCEGGWAPKLRPYVCLKAGLNPVWTPLTGSGREERLEVVPEWRSGGLWMWRDHANHLQDGARVVTGPVAAFVALSHHEETDYTNRARVTSAGLAAILREREERLARLARFRQKQAA